MSKKWTPKPIRATIEEKRLPAKPDELQEVTEMTIFSRSTAIEKLVRTSKERCRSQHGLVSVNANPVLRLQSNELSQRREKFLDQIGGAAAELDKSTLLPHRSRYCMLVSDADGIVIESYIPEGLEAEFQRSGLAVGGLWDERVAGTNGIDLASKSGRAVTVTGKDHFHSCFYDFACSSAPLTDAEDNLIGTVTLVGSTRRRAEEIAMCEQSLRRASRQFKSRLFRSFHAERMTARIMSRDPETRRSYETLVACNEEGVIVSHLPLWRSGEQPLEHKGIVGKHLTDLSGMGLAINVRGPAIVPPKRRVSQPEHQQTLPLVRKDTKLGRFAGQGGDCSVLAERARKLAAHRVPLLLCGEPGVGTEEIARALIEDQKLESPMGLALDADRIASASELAEALNSLQFLCEYPINDHTPTLILQNVDKLSGDAQLKLETFLASAEDEQGVETRERKPLLLFTANGTWDDLETGGRLGRNLLYLMGQSVLELPPLRMRDKAIVLDDFLANDVARPAQVSDQAREVLLSYDWPGNNREMRAVIREALICGNGNRINATDLPDRLSNRRTKPEAASLRASLSEALDSSDWNVTKAAKLLGKSRATVNRWIAAEGLQRPD
ncbi:helix-turn-helix domain-containing protein [Leisingera sp. SS27]|uniref:helix-turn-helix domain-containing protein n=1 Tax=Leisingera sp. SS27 TaxID=2979462 RepID=UPI00232D8DB3|nr:helix-turn-helix domain-containing protein [Leisingera sp. SS27]MDC0660548.1 helix-turn-helix domain-containing protein [Leisingera sp. SS27]